MNRKEFPNKLNKNRKFNNKENLNLYYIVIFKPYLFPAFGF